MDERSGEFSSRNSKEFKQREQEIPNWLAKKSEIKEIKDKKLKSFVSSLSRFEPKVIGSEFLTNRLTFLQNQIDLRVVNEKEGEEFLSRIYSTIKDLQKKTEQAKPFSSKELAEEIAKAERKSVLGELDLGLPSKEKVAEQRRFVRNILEKIESSSRDCHDLTISSLVFSLESSLGKMNKNLKEEVESRLALHDSSELIKQANGWISRPEGMTGLNMGLAMEEAVRRNHELNRRKVKFLLNNNKKEGLVGLNVPKAWDLLQNAVFNYEKILKELGLKQGLEILDDELGLGKVPSNFFTVSNSIVKEKVRDYLIGRLGGGRAAEKSLELAEKLAVTTLETSVFNTSVAGNDELAAIINLKTWRKGRSLTGRDRGPRIHENSIEGFGTSWLRFIAGKDAKEILTSKEIFENAEKIAEGSCLYYSAVLLKKYKDLKGLILDRTPKAYSIDKNFLQKAVDYFNKVDKPKENEKHGQAFLRVFWILGVVDLALAKEGLEWDARAFKELEKAVIEEELSPKAGSFLRRKDWDWIKEKTDFNRRLKKLIAFRVTRESFKNIRF